MGERFDHILVDEYQDSNRLQASIVRRLRPDGTGVFVVGDDAQSIYAFRGAAVENILGFAQQYAPPAARITLDVNYRSLQPVLDAANALLADSVHQYPKTLVAHRRHCGQRPGLVCVLDEREQADFITEQVLAQREAGIALKRQAVLFRSAQHSDFLEVELTRRNIPFVKHGGLKFLEAAHIKDLLAVLRWADRPAHRVAAFRALQLMPGFGPAHARRCLEMIAGRPDPLTTLAGFAAPPASAGHWPAFVELMAQLASPDSRWPHELGPSGRLAQATAGRALRQPVRARHRPGRAGGHRRPLREPRTLPDRTRDRSAAGQRRPVRRCIARRRFSRAVDRAFGQGTRVAHGVRAQRRRRQFPQ
ncbi:MAG: ATP-dependent helicase [Burkholderiaceae bacterium]|nr:ATP-dependent helicase [Burkholderiaceae bacterium]